MILLLEDDETLRDIIGMILTDLGFEYKTASTCAEAIGILRENSPVVLLTDMLLAEGDASEAVKFCQQKHAKCKTILLTAMQKRAADEVLITLKMDHLLMKPFDIGELDKLLR